jgi:hypothetical protein
MNYFKLIVALLASASFVSAAANPRADADGVCELNLADVVQIIENGDNLAQVAEVINGCRNLVYNAVLKTCLFEMIRLREHALFHFVFPFVDFGNRGRRGNDRNTSLYELLQYAVSQNNIEIIDYLLGRGLLISHMGGGGLWQTAENLEVLRPLLTRHPEQAEYLSPTQMDMATVQNVDHARALVAATHLCDDLRGQHTFDANEWLAELAVSGIFIEDHELVPIARYLIQEEGAQLNEWIRGIFVDRRPEALRLIEEGEEPIKDPGVD